MYLADRKLRVKEGRLCSGALSNGTILANLVEVVSGRLLRRWKEAQTREDRLENVNISLSFLRKTVPLEVSSLSPCQVRSSC